MIAANRVQFGRFVLWKAGLRPIGYGRSFAPAAIAPPHPMSNATPASETPLAQDELAGASAPTLRARGSVHVKLNDADLGHWRNLSLLMLTAAAVGIEVVPFIGDIEMASPWIFHACAVVCLLTGLAFRQVPLDRMQALGRGVLTVGSGVITVLVATTYPVSWFALFYFWPLLAAAYVFTRAGFIATVTGVLVAYAAALSINIQHTGEDYPLLAYVMFALGLTTVMIAVRLLREGIDALMQRLEVVSNTDTLTGLANRRTFEREFARLSERATKYSEPLTVLLFDLDHFKAINDTYGHPQGDIALRRFAELLSEASRDDDTPARIGGEEFALIMHGATAADASAFAVRFAATLRADGERDDGNPPVTVSIGVAELSTQTASSEMLLVEADRALYEAKRTGRDRVVIASAP